MGQAPSLFFSSDPQSFIRASLWQGKVKPADVGTGERCKVVDHETEQSREGQREDVRTHRARNVDAMWLAPSLACGWNMLFQVRQGTVPAQAPTHMLDPRRH